MIYRIVDWHKNFENNRTRELTRMSWIPVPNKHDGDGFTDLLSRKDGTALYGAWHLILQVASKCEPRGTLIRTIPHEGAAIPHEGAAIPHEGAAHTAASIARVSRGDSGVIQRALDACVEIGWIEVISKDGLPLQNPAPKCDNPAPSCDAVLLCNTLLSGGVGDFQNLCFDDFKAAAEMWITHRKEIRHALKPTAIKGFLKKCSEWGRTRAIAAINHSVGQGYQGLFEDKANSSGTPARGETFDEAADRMCREIRAEKKRNGQ